MPASDDGCTGSAAGAVGGVPAEPAVGPGRRGAGRDCFRSWNILHSIQTLFRRLWDLGFDAVNWLWRYFLLGAVIVIPIWLLSRLFGSPRGR